jgi:hypothetical protein
VTLFGYQVSDLWIWAVVEGQQWIDQVFSSPRQMVAHAAALAAVACLVSGALMRRMIPLRWLASGANIGLIVYGILHPSPITALIAAAVLPVNLYRALEVTRLARRVTRAAAAAETASIWLRPHMRRRKLSAGAVLFRKGDSDDHLYLLAEGRLELAEIAQALEPGRIFGEVAIFHPDHRRTQTVRAVTNCLILEIDAAAVRQLFFQHPAFAFHLVELLVDRLVRDVRRAEERAAQPGVD